MLPLIATLDLDPWDLVRVDVPDYPGADATSARGSVLLAPPDDPSVPWRPEPVPLVDGDVAWEALDAMAVEPWHAAGLDGSGVKIAIFDVQWYEVDLRAAGESPELGAYETHDCYAHRSCLLPIDSLRPRFTFESGAHGVACAEVIHDVAPGAELHLVRVNGLTSLENAVDWAVREGIDLVSMSLSYFNESFYDGTGDINDQMDELAAGGVMMVTSAGNYADAHWAERFRDTDGDGLHEFPWGSEYLPISVPEGEARVNLIWDQFDACGASDLDGYVFDSSGDLAGRSTSAQDDGDESCAPVERIRVNAVDSGWHYLQVHLAGGSPNVGFDVLAPGAEVWNTMPGGTVVDPGNHPAVIAVGAVRAAGYATNGAESFSSRGPTVTGLPKPEIAGPDGLSTSVYGPTGFYGTSASTPAVVGALALLMEEDPTLYPWEASDRLRAAALSEELPWAEADMDLGSGRARLPAPGATAPCGGCAAAGSLAPPLCFGWPLLRRRRARYRLPGGAPT